jgi:crotonobetainyl-CoA:carnitine CoA-transferase CaiB-like acyl-CoA transferase
MSLPLDGLVVVALEQALSAPFCTRHLGDLGARVIKVENVDGGDFARSYDDVVHGMSAHFTWLNRNKESVSLDLHTDAGREVLHRLVARAEVVVQNLGPGSAARLGVAATDVVRAHPRAIAVDISGYGTGGPYDDRRAYDLLAQAEGGSCAMTGLPGQLAKPGIPAADLGASMYALSSILAALHARNTSGKGTAISVSMLDVVAEWMGFALNQARYGASPEPNGLSSPMVSPYGAYPTRNGHTVVFGTTNDAEFRRVADMISRPDLADDPDFATNAGRKQHRDRLDAAIGAWTSGQTLAEVQAAADAAKIGHGRLNQLSDVLTHPQLEARERWVEVDSPVGPVTSLLPPIAAADWKLRTDPIPGLGEHTTSVLSWLGYGPAEIDALVHAGVARDGSR